MKIHHRVIKCISNTETDHQVKGNLKDIKWPLLSVCLLCCLQEAYWRIPGSLSLQDLKKRVEVIGKALDGSLIAQDNSEYLTSY
jgi:hypothetical protein